MSMNGPRVLVFVAENCHFCKEYKKRFGPIASRLAGRKIPVHLGDVARDANARRYANQYRVRATPTTIGITSRGRMIRLEGAVNDAEITKMFEQVLVIS